MPAPKQPQDRKKKATEATEPEFTFDHDGKTYALPTADKYAGNVPGGITADALLEPDNEVVQLRLGLAMLNAVEGHDEARAVMRSMSSQDMFTVLGEWMSFGDGELSVPQS